MSSYKRMTITCQDCGKESEAVIWDSINTTLNAEMKQAVRNRTGFQWKCPFCGKESTLDYGFLYHQMEDKMMISYCSDPDGVEGNYRMFTETEETGMMEMLHKDNYLLRIVTSFNSFREKLYIFDEGLDDRIIELCKLALRVRITEDHPEFTRPHILFCTKENGERAYDIFNDGKYVGNATFQQEMYDGLLEAYNDILPDMRKDDPIINDQWALEFFKSRGEADEHEG